MWTLGPYQLDPARFALTRGDEPIPLQRRPFDALLYLVTHRERVVSRDELLEVVWEGVVVTPGAVSTAVHEIRGALGDLDRPRQERWIETVRGRGFRFAGPALHEPERVVVEDPVPFVGRSAPLAELRARLERLRQGTGGVVLIEGPAGMGKTRLIQEIASTAGSVPTAHCEPDGPPLWPFLQLAGVLGATVEAVSAEHRSHVARVDAIAGLLQSAGERAPTMVVIEDLHWADRPSLAILESLAARMAALPVLLVLTQRTADERAVPAHGLSESPLVDCIRLEPLQVRHLFPLVGAILGRVPAPELVGRMERASGGNPLIVRELARRLSLEEESWSDVPKLARRVFSSRFDALGAEVRHGLSVAALCGSTFDAPLVEAAAGESLPTDRSWVRAGVRAGILSPMAD
ncbi:MAG: AAA family ATPase, partial [Proteobacteria bacterium]|nr:AAA family ATPase [Pseudomonadota bacterium]